MPRAVTNFLPAQYAVALTRPSLEARNFDQVVYQLAHELTHVVVDPTVTNPLVEVMACTMSLVLLDVMAADWEAASQPRARRAYAAAFRAYRASVVSSAYAALGLGPGLGPGDAGLGGHNSSAAVLRWGRVCDFGCEDRSAQLVAASLLAPCVAAMDSWSVVRLVREAVVDVDVGVETLQAQGLGQGQIQGESQGESQQQPSWRATASLRRWRDACTRSPHCSSIDADKLLTLLQHHFAIDDTGLTG